MLQNLHVKNLALIDEVEMNFDEKLNILTGETGTGKSILIGSIESILGKKISKDMIRPGENSALIELIFEVKQQELLELLDYYGIPVEDDQVIVKRIISEKRSMNKINDATVTLQTLKEISSRLLDLHGQQEHQILLKDKKQLEILDHFLDKKGKNVLLKVATYYKELRELEKQLEEYTLDEQQRLREIDFLEHEIAEIQETSLQEGEDEELESEYQRMLHSKDIVRACGTTYQMLSDESHSNISDTLGMSMKELQSVLHLDATLEDFYQQLLQMEDLMSDFQQQLAEYIDCMEFDEKTYQETEERLNRINHLKDKYGKTIQDILEYEKNSVKKLEILQNFEEEKDKLQQKLQIAKEHYDSCAVELTKIRKKVAKKLEKDITEALIELNFIQVRFEIRITTVDEKMSDGCNQVAFYISTNPGLPLRPMKEVASGGELSRIMLAMKSVLADVDQVGTLVFDEIDVGISGETANKVAKRMAVIAKNHQVIAITHLPQIAAMADSHYSIEKHSKNNQTTTSVQKLSEEDSIKEIARMISGDDISQTVLDNVKEMKDLASASKKY